MHSQNNFDNVKKNIFNYLKTHFEQVDFIEKRAAVWLKHKLIKIYVFKIINTYIHATKYFQMSQIFHKIIIKMYLFSNITH